MEGLVHAGFALLMCLVLCSADRRSGIYDALVEGKVRFA